MIFLLLLCEMNKVQVKSIMKEENIEIERLMEKIQENGRNEW